MVLPNLRGEECYNKERLLCVDEMLSTIKQGSVHCFGQHEVLGDLDWINLSRVVGIEAVL